MNRDTEMWVICFLVKITLSWNLLTLLSQAGGDISLLSPFFCWNAKDRGNHLHDLYVSESSNLAQYWQEV